MIIIFDESPRIKKRDELIKKLEKDNIDIKLVNSVKNSHYNLKNGMSNSIEVKQIIYHCSGREGVSVPEAKSILKEILKVKGNAILIVVSAGINEYHPMAKTLGVDIVTTYDNLYTEIEEISCNIEVSWAEAFDIYCRTTQKKIEYAEIVKYILNLFFPLDLDTQALIMLNEEKRNIYLEAIQIDKDKPYINLIHSTIEILTKYQGIDLPDTFFTLIGIDKNSFKPNTGSNIYKFLEALDDTLNNFDSFNDTTKETKTNDILYFFGKEGWKVEGANPPVITSFHDWYCDLASSLKEIKDLSQ